LRVKAQVIQLQAEIQEMTEQTFPTIAQDSIMVITNVSDKNVKLNADFDKN
jgi:hypothetical protein